MAVSQLGGVNWGGGGTAPGTGGSPGMGAAGAGCGGGGNDGMLKGAGALGRLGKPWAAGC